MKKNQYSDLFLDQTKDLVWAVDRNLLLVYANKAYLNLMKEVTGVEKVLNTPILIEGFGEGYVKKWKSYYQRALSREYFEIEEHFYNPETKEMQYGHITFCPIGDESGEILTVACRSADITPVVRQKDHASRLMDASLDVFCTIDEAGKFVFVSAASADHWGYRPDELIGKPFRDMIVEEDFEKTDLVAAEILAGREFKSFSNRYLKKNGDIAYNLWSARWDQESKLMYCVARDAKDKIEEEAEKELLSQISLNFNNEEELIPAASHLCENLYAFGKFDLIELWCPNMEHTQIKLIGHSTQNQDFYELEQLGTSFQKNEGMPGKVWNKGKQLLWDEKQINKYFIRKKGASHLGLQAILGTPLTFKDELVGVLLIGTKRNPDYLEQHSLGLSRLEKFIGSEINRKRLENDLSNVFDAIPEILCITDLEGRFLKINNAGCALLGYATDEVLLHSLNKFTLKEDQGKFEQKIKDLTNEASVFTFENRFLSKDGQVIWLSWNCNPALEEGLVYASAKNITAEVQLRELNEQAGSLAKIGSWEINLEKNTVFWSQIVHQLHETDADSFYPDLETAIDFYREDFRALVHSSIENSITSGKGFDFEAVIITKKLKERWVRAIGNVEVVNGKVKRIYGSFQDIHDRKTSEEALRESEAKFRTIFEIASLGIAQVSLSDGQFLFVNSYYEEITGYSLEELLQMKFPELTHPDDRKRDWDLFSKAAKGEIEYRNEKRYIKKDGSIVWIRIHLAFIRDKEGNPVKTVAICENITDRKEIESQLKNLSDNLPGVVFQYLLFPDGTDTLRSVSKGSYQVWGYSPEEVEKDINLVWNQTKAGGEYEQVKKDVIEAVSTKSKWFSRYKSVQPSGEVHVHLGSGTPSFLVDGTVLFNSFVMDITKETKKEELLTDATHMARIGSWEVNLVKNNILWSDIMYELHEIDPTTFIPELETNIEFYREDFRDMVRSNVQACIEDGKPFDFEAVLVTAKNNEKWVRAIGRAEIINGECKRIHGSFQDINNIKIVEHQKNSLLTTLENSLNEIYVFDAQTLKFISVNKGARINLGYSENEIKELTPLNLKPEFTLSSFNELVTPLVTKETEKIIFFTNHKRKNGSLYPVEVHLQFIEEGNNKRFLAIILDITERKKVEEKLLYAYQEKDNILESIGDAFFAVDNKWTVTYWNKQAEKILGRVKKDIVGKNLWDTYPDAIDTDFYGHYHRAMETGETVNFEAYYPTLDIWVEVTVYTSENGLSIYFKDITLRKAADIRLSKANERFELVTKATNDAIWDWDIENDDFSRSKNIHKIFGSNASTKLKKNQFWQDSFHPEEVGKLEKSIQSALNDTQSERWEMEYKVLNDNDEELFVIDRGIIVRNKNGKATRMVGAMTDLTKQKKLEKQLSQLNESLKNYAKELERSNEELEQFAFIASHDLQEPLRMIASFMDQLKRKYADQLDDKALQYIHFATDGAKRMKQIILDLLLFSRANKPSEQLEEVNLNEIVSEYTQLRRKLIVEKNAIITYDSLPALKTYSAPITQIIHCLLDNALRYVKENVPTSIEIHAKEKESVWEFSVKDNGIGIDEKFYDKIFIIFQRLHNRNQQEGTGIGLSIAKRSVEFLGGKIWLESTVGEGSTFYFTIAKNNP